MMYNALLSVEKHKCLVQRVCGTNIYTSKYSKIKKSPKSSYRILKNQSIRIKKLLKIEREQEIHITVLCFASKFQTLEAIYNIWKCEENSIGVSENEFTCKKPGQIILLLRIINVFSNKYVTSNKIPTEKTRYLGKWIKKHSKNSHDIVKKSIQWPTFI